MKTYMKKYIINTLLSVFTLILVLFVSYTSYDNSNDAVKRVRIKSAQETQEVLYESANCFSLWNTFTHNIDNMALLQDGAGVEIIETISNKALTFFFVLILVFSLFQFYLYIRNWLIKVSQSNNKLFLVHYFHMKDGKKDALSRV